MTESRRFPPPWTIEENQHGFQVKSANGFTVAHVYHRQDLHDQKWSYAYDNLTWDEARRIARAIARLPEFMQARRGFPSRGGGDRRWKASHPYHVALEDSYLRRHWDEIDALCKYNGIPFEPTGEIIRREGVWCVHEFSVQLDAMMFWDRFEGRWLRGEDFIYPERPKDMPAMKPAPNLDKLLSEWRR